MPVEAGDIVAGLTALGIEHGVFIGTSRGGLIIHVLAAIRPAALKAVILNDVGPVVEGEGLAHIRAYLERAPKPQSFADAVAIQRAAHGSAFPALDTADWERMVDALYRWDNGVLTPDFDPKLLNMLKDFDLNKPLPELWPQFEGLAGIPLLAIRGANSKLLSAETLAEMARRHPDCRAVTVEGQGHAPLLETGALPQIIRDFIGRAEQKHSAANSSSRPSAAARSALIAIRYSLRSCHRRRIDKEKPGGFPPGFFDFSRSADQKVNWVRR